MSDAMAQVMDTLDGQINNTEGSTVETTTVEMEESKGRKDPDFVHMPLTPELLAALRTVAGTTALGPYVQEMVAKQLNVVLPERENKRQRYSTEEARQAAKVAARDKAANLRKGLLMAHRARAAGDAVKLAEAEALIAANS